MRIETKAKVIVWTLAGMLVYSVFARLAHSGADIPVDPHYIILNAPRITRTNNCLPTWTAKKMYRCDRVFVGGFQ